MKVSKSQYREWNTSLPESIRAGLCHFQVNVTFEELYRPSSNRDEPLVEQLFNWCEENCNSIWTQEKLSYETFKFSFWTLEDCTEFLTFVDTLHS